MEFKIFYTPIVFSFFLLACSSNQNDAETAALKNHLSPSLVENPISLDSDSSQIKTLGRIQFDDTIHDFGRIVEGEIVEFDFDFENVGKKDILISEAKASCGCTVPAYPEAPLKSGMKDKIKVTFNSQGKKGYNEKLIIVTTNGNPSVYNLYIRAEVHEK